MTSYHGSPLTAEEEYLLERFRILREKKKLLQKLKEKAETNKVKPTVKRELVKTSSITPEDAKKKAEMLVASGCVKISKSSVNREFKRARISDKKVVKDNLSDQESTVSVERNFKATPSEKSAAMKEMYISNFVKSGQSRDTDSHHSGRGYREPRKGNTIFIKGHGLTEEIIRNEFLKFGTVTDVRFERDRRYGFVTYKSCEEAERAIKEMNGAKISEGYAQVSFAWKQFHNDRGNNSLWSTHRDTQPQDRPEKPRNNRELQKYGDEDDFF